jgi:hypothetical protein
VAGFGENDCDPLIATTLMVTTFPSDGEGPAGFALLLLFAPQPPTPRPSAPTANIATQVFMISFRFNEWS